MVFRVAGSLVNYVSMLVNPLNEYPLNSFHSPPCPDQPHHLRLDIMLPYLRSAKFALYLYARPSR